LSSRCRLSPAATDGKEAKRSGCLGSGVSLPDQLSRERGKVDLLKVGVFARFVRGEPACGVVHQQPGQEIVSGRSELLEALTKDREAAGVSSMMADNKDAEELRDLRWADRV